MPIYNLYFMNNRGHIDRIKHVEAFSDDAVISTARKEEGRQPIEIWSEHRKVHRIEALTDSDVRLEWQKDRLTNREETVLPGLQSPPVVLPKVVLNSDCSKDEVIKQRCALMDQARVAATGKQLPAATSGQANGGDQEPLHVILSQVHRLDNLINSPGGREAEEG